MGTKRTKFLVYVDKSTMDEPDVLFQAVMAHFIKKDLDSKLRKEFFAKFFKMSRSGSKAKQLASIEEWVSVRDAATFPFRKQQEEVKEVKDATLRNADDVRSGAKDTTLRNPADTKHTLHMKVFGDPCSGKTEFHQFEGVADAGKGVEGGVSVDDGADESPESGVASDGGNTVDGCDDDGDGGKGD